MKVGVRYSPGRLGDAEWRRVVPYLPTAQPAAANAIATDTSQLAPGLA